VRLLARKHLLAMGPQAGVELRPEHLFQAVPQQLFAAQSQHVHVGSVAKQVALLRVQVGDHRGHRIDHQAQPRFTLLHDDGGFCAGSWLSLV